MKTYKILFSLLLASVFLITACQQDDYELGTMLSKSEINYEVIQEYSIDEGGNTVILRNNTPGTVSMWDYGTGRSTRMVDTIRFAFQGEYVIKFSAVTAGGIVEMDPITIEVTDDNLNYVNDPLWLLLSGGPGNEKTWLLDFDADGVSKYFNGPLYFAHENWSWGNTCEGEDCWMWDPSVQGNDWIADPGDYGTMTFNLKGGPFVTVDHKLTTGRGTEEGTYYLDINAKTLTLTDVWPLQNSWAATDAGNDFSMMKVITLTEDAMQLAVQHASKAEVIILNYISKEYSDNWVPADLPDPEPPYSGDAITDLTTNVTTSKTWKVNLNYPYNWHGLDGAELNEVASTADQPDGFAFTTWVPPYDAAAFEAISITFAKGDGNEGTYEIVVGAETYEGTYSVDDKNNIDFGQSIQLVSNVGGWLNIGTTAENSMRIIKAQYDPFGNISNLWLGQRDAVKDEYISLHLVPSAAAGGDPSEAIKNMIVAKTWKIDSERTYDVATSWGAEQGPMMFSDYATWAWNPLPGEHYAAGEAGIDYGTMKFESNGTVVVNQRVRTYTYVDEETTETTERQGMPQEGDVLASEEVVELNGTWELDMEANTLTLSVGVLHPWTCDYAVADWGDLTIYRIEENALLLQATRSFELSGEDEMPMTYIFVPVE